MKVPTAFACLLAVADANTCTTTQNQDCDGDDIANQAGTSPQDCCDACANTSGCKAYVFVQGGSYNDMCYLKSVCIPKSGCAGTTCTSGVASDAPTPAPTPAPAPAPVPTPSTCQVTVTEGQDCDGADISNVPGSSTDDCCAACKEEVGCGAFVWVQGGTSSNTCFLKTYCAPKSGCNGNTCSSGVMPLPPTPPTPPVPPSPSPVPVPAGISVRVHKALGSRGYDKLRVSLIRTSTATSEPPAFQSSVSPVAWTYQDKFRYKWTNMHLSSAVVDVVPGKATPLNLEGYEINVKVPKKEEGSVGLLLADPCVVQSQWCPYANTWDVEHTYQNVLNSLAVHDELDYWMNVGDLFYDQSGGVTSQFFSGLSMQAQAKIHGVTMGNHDYWQNGHPGTASSSDNFGNGLMQWYAQDAISAKDDESQPFDFSADPSTYQVATANNFFWYNMVGDVAFVSFSGAQTWDASASYFEEACNWAQDQNPSLLVLLGHWNSVDDGCESGMDTGDVHTKVAALPGCSALSSRIKYFEGHKHCNQIMEDNTGFMIGANGMTGCGDFGIFMLDTRGGEATLSHFPMGSGGRRLPKFNEILSCITTKGYSACKQYAETWMQQPTVTQTQNKTALLI